MQLPEPRLRTGVSPAQGVQQPGRRDPIDHPKRGRVRRHRPEQRVLLANRAEVSDALAAIDQHHRQIADHSARVMTATPLLDHGQTGRQPLREPHFVSDLRDLGGPGVRDQPRSVRRHFYGYGASITHHLQGEPPSQGSRNSQPQESLLRRTTPRPRNPGARVLPQDPG